MKELNILKHIFSKEEKEALIEDKFWKIMKSSRREIIIFVRTTSAPTIRLSVVTYTEALSTFRTNTREERAWRPRSQLDAMETTQDQGSARSASECYGL